MTDRKRLFKLNEHELHELLELYFYDEIKSLPINAQAFIDHFIEKFEIKPLLNSEDKEKLEKLGVKLTDQVCRILPVDTINPNILSPDWKVNLK